MRGLTTAPLTARATRHPRAAAETNATLSFTLNRTTLKDDDIDPADIMFHRVDSAGTHHAPVTPTVTAVTNTSVTVVAETTGFSTFLLATAPETTGGADGSLEASDTETEVELGPGDESDVTTPGFGALPGLVAIAVLAVIAAVRGRQ